MRSLVSIEKKTKRAKYVIPAPPRGHLNTKEAAKGNQLKRPVWRGKEQNRSATSSFWRGGAST
eukprot:10176979-Ditylum_brightwellii.AAC.1